MRTFYAKSLLFGEHIVLQGAKALAMPWQAYSGQWQWTETELTSLQQNLPALLRYLIKLDTEGLLLASLDLTQFAADLQNGIYFKANIPTGYGAGSSGALSAAIYDHYLQKVPTDNLLLLKKQLAQIESFFHGASSGTDPLICYLERAILIHNSKEIEVIELDFSKWPDSHQLFVIDTHLSRQTGPYVNAFIERTKQPAFQQAMQQQLIPASDAAIKAILQHDFLSLMKQWNTVCQFQWKHIPDFIPDTFHSLWQEALAASDFKLKICGAGGGGFLLGFCNNPARLQQLSTTYKVQVIR